MNERIKQLEKQCWQSSQTDPYALFDVKKFSQLIVIKCAEIADTAEPFLASDLIKQHFGVEE
jgi:hypothetical protein